jgi:hypothetical protein
MVFVKDAVIDLRPKSITPLTIILARSSCSSLSLSVNPVIDAGTKSMSEMNPRRTFGQSLTKRKAKAGSKEIPPLMSSSRRFRRQKTIPGLDQVMKLYAEGRFPKPSASIIKVMHDADCDYPRDRSPCTCKHGPDLQIIAKEPS